MHIWGLRRSVRARNGPYVTRRRRMGSGERSETPERVCKCRFIGELDRGAGHWSSRRGLALDPENTSRACERSDVLAAPGGLKRFCKVAGEVARVMRTGQHRAAVRTGEMARPTLQAACLPWSAAAVLQRWVVSVWQRAAGHPTTTIVMSARRARQPLSRRLLAWGRPLCVAQAAGGANGRGRADSSS